MISQEERLLRSNQCEEPDADEEVDEVVNSLMEDGERCDPWEPINWVEAVQNARQIEALGPEMREWIENKAFDLIGRKIVEAVHDYWMARARVEAEQILEKRKLEGADSDE